MKKFLFIVLIFCVSCSSFESQKMKIKLVVLDPGHFHAALVQKSMYENVDTVVHVYAPASEDIKNYIDKVNAYNSRKENPTSWQEEVYVGNDFLEKMLEEKTGNVVVLAGNNRRKTEYISKSLQHGFNVLADKPMAINSEGFKLLKKSFDEAKKNNLLLYDIMTERFEITTMLQKEFASMPEVFGELEKGTLENPAVVMNSVHYFYKYVSGNVLKRPAWYMDVTQQGEGIVDVTTHLVDLVQWECFPEQIIDYTKDIEMQSAKRWATNMSLSEFKAITQLDSFPKYYQNSLIDNNILPVYCNGEINYRIKNVYAKVTALWNYKADAGGDEHYSLLRGTKANLEIKQSVLQNFQPTLYIKPISENESEQPLFDALKKIQEKYKGVDLKKVANGWEVIIPSEYKEGHEAHFARVTQNFLEYLQNRNMPAWEVPNMLAKYYTTTKALELAKKN